MICERLKKVILKTLDLDEFDFQGSTTAPQVPGWDSLNHIRILTAVEEEFRVRFRSLEIIRLRDLGDLQTLIDRKLGAAQ
jgi:acyl carrier protein